MMRKIVANNIALVIPPSIWCFQDLRILDRNWTPAARFTADLFGRPAIWNSSMLVLDTIPSRLDSFTVISFSSSSVIMGSCSQFRRERNVSRARTTFELAVKRSSTNSASFAASLFLVIDDMATMSLSKIFGSRLLSVYQFLRISEASPGTMINCLNRWYSQTPFEISRSRIPSCVLNFLKRTCCGFESSMNWPLMQLMTETLV